MSDKSNTVVVIGATGLLGRKIVAQLKVSGYRPLVLTRNPLKATKVFDGNFDFCEWDGRDVDQLKEIVNSTKAVINLSGKSIAKRWTEKSKKFIINSRINITNSIVQAINAAQVPPEAYIQASATGFYPHNSDELFDEDSKTGSGFLSKLVLDWEQASKGVDSKVRHIVIRTGVVLSAEGGFLKEVMPSIKSFAGGWFGSGKQRVSWIHIDDHAKAVCYLLENTSCNGAYNLVSPSPIEMKLLLKKVGNALKRPVWAPIPTFFMRLIFGEMANEVLLSNQSVFPKRLINSGFVFAFEDIDAALEDLLH